MLIKHSHPTQPFICVKQLLKNISNRVQKQRQKASLKNGETLVNCLFHDVWVFTYTQNNEEKTVATDVSYSDLEDITEEEKIYLKSLLLELCGGYQDQTQRLNRPSSNATTLLKRIYEFSKGENQPLHIELWRRETLKAFVKWVVEDRFSKGIGIGANTLNNGYIAKFRFLHNRQMLSFKPPNVEQVHKLAEPVIKRYAAKNDYDCENMFYADWKKGGNLASVPLEVAMTLLGYCLELLKSDEVKILESYFYVTRKIGANGEFGHEAPTKKFLEDFFSGVYDEGIERFYYDQPQHMEKDQFEIRCTWISFFCKEVKERFGGELGYSYERFNKAFRSLIDSGVDFSFNCIRSKNKPVKKKVRNVTCYGALIQYVAHVYDSMYVLMLCLTGFRYHEIRNISAHDCIKQDADGTYKLETTIDKTTAGLIKRTVHPVLNDVVKLLINLTYIQKDIVYEYSEYKHRSKYESMAFSGAPSLFSRALAIHSAIEGCGGAAFGSKQSNMSFRNETANSMIKNVWNLTSARLDPKLKASFEAKLTKGSLSSHGFRHTWVEFALLNFTDSTEGGVLFGIARNFGYSPKDFTNFIENYTTGKFSHANKREVEKEVTKTLVLRLFGEVVQKAIENPSDPSTWLPKNFKGDMATKLALHIRGEVEDVIMATEADLYEVAEEIVDHNLVRIEPNPWGYCILFVDGQNKAACIDTKHDIQKENGGAFELCIKCPNHLIYLPVNEEYLQQTQITHNQVITFYEKDQDQVIDFNSPEQRTKILQASQKAIQNIQRHLGIG